MPTLQESHEWTTFPLVTNGPMRLIALAPLAVAVSAAGGLGFIGAGDDLTTLDKEFTKAAELIASQSNLQAYRDQTGILPVAFGVLNWGADIELAAAAVAKWKPAAVWFFGAYRNQDYVNWTQRLRAASEGKTKIWIQVFTVADALEVARTCMPDVLVVQGTDAGGHGIVAGAGIISLLPEVNDELQKAGFAHINLITGGGIMEGRGLAAALALGAQGVTLGTRFLCSEEANIAHGYQQEVIRSSDGGISTGRSKVYDQLRGTTDWPERYNGRGILNESFYDYNAGMSFEENKKLYNEALKKGDRGWGDKGRLTAYAGTGVGLVHTVMKAGDIVRELRKDAQQRISALYK